MTSDTVVVSTVGAALRERGISVSELQRRLARRGVRVSRGALDRLASEEPLRAVSFDVLLPVLEELSMELEDALAMVSTEEVRRHEQERARAHAVARALARGGAGAAGEAPGRHERDEAGDGDNSESAAADEALLSALRDRVRQEHPEAFDERGRLRTRELTAAILRRFGSTRLTGEQVDAVIRAGRAAGERKGR